MVDSKIIEKIQKLLSLANSDNEHEAKNATKFANELLLKYNLSLQQVEDQHLEYEVLDVHDAGLTVKPHQKQIVQILMNYFFVRVIFHSICVGKSSGEFSRYNGPRARYKKMIQMVGTKGNCQIASYIFSYLNDVYPRLWQEYYDRNSRVDLSHKNSYYAGLTIGIMEVLEESKFRVQEQMGLVLKDDPELLKFVKERATGTYGMSVGGEKNRQAYEDGVKDGANVTLRKPIESTSTNSNAMLEGKRK